MSQRLSNWASVAEIRASIAVLITLALLIHDVRENTKTTRAATYASTLDSLNEFQGIIFTNENALRVWDAYIRPLHAQRARQLVLQLSLNVRRHGYSDAAIGRPGGRSRPAHRVVVVRRAKYTQVSATGD